MARGYKIENIKEKIIGILQNSKTGLSGIEISEKLGINRITITKYLNIFATEGLVKQKSIGNVNLWYIKEGIDKLHFPDDYFKVKAKYLEYLISGSTQKIHAIIRNSIYSDADPLKMIIEVIIPAIQSVQDSYEKGKIGKSEKNFLDDMIFSSLQNIGLIERESETKKNVIIISADSTHVLSAQAASAAFRSSNWQVSNLGDMSSAIDVMFDIDFQKFLNKVWSTRQGIMIVLVFSSTENGFKFFSEAVNSCKTKFGKSLCLVLCSPNSKKTKIKADFITENLETVLQWCQTRYEGTMV